jgi:hypothetical protein
LVTAVSRDILRAVLEVRDRRHNETHAILLTMFQSMVTELIEQGALAPAPLADRLDLSRSAIKPAAEPPRAMVRPGVGARRGDAAVADAARFGATSGNGSVIITV